MATAWHALGDGCDKVRTGEYTDALRRAYERAAFIADVDVPGTLARAAMAIADRENGEAWDEGYRMNRPHDSQECRDLINPYRAKGQVASSGANPGPHFPTPSRSRTDATVARHERDPDADVGSVNIAPDPLITGSPVVRLYGLVAALREAADFYRPYERDSARDEAMAVVSEAFRYLSDQLEGEEIR